MERRMNAAATTMPARIAATPAADGEAYIQISTPMKK